MDSYDELCNKSVYLNYKLSVLSVPYKEIHDHHRNTTYLILKWIQTDLRAVPQHENYHEKNVLSVLSVICEKVHEYLLVLSGSTNLVSSQIILGFSFSSVVFQTNVVNNLDGFRPGVWCGIRGCKKYTKNRKPCEMWHIHPVMWRKCSCLMYRKRYLPIISCLGKG